LLRALIRQFTGFWGPDTLAYRRDASLEAERLADRVGDVASSFWVYTDLWYVAVADGDIELRRRSALRWTQYADELENQPGLDWLIATIRVMQRLMDGQFDEAAGVAQRAYECAEMVGLSRATSLLNRLMSGVAEQRGDEESTIPAFSAHIANAHPLDGARASLVRALVLSGDVDRARVEYEDMANQNFPALWDTYWLLISCNWAEAAVSVDDVRGAQVLYERLAPWHRQIAVMPSAVGCAVSMYLGMLASTIGEQVTAQSHFEAALETHERVGLPFALARTRVLLARELAKGASSDDHTRAVQLLTTAAAEAQQFGFGRVRREAEGLLAALSFPSQPAS
jgi:hypothetical protein